MMSERLLTYITQSLNQFNQSLKNNKIKKSHKILYTYTQLVHNDSIDAAITQHQKLGDTHDYIHHK